MTRTDSRLALALFLSLLMHLLPFLPALLPSAQPRPAPPPPPLQAQLRVPPPPPPLHLPDPEPATTTAPPAPAPVAQRQPAPPRARNWQQEVRRHLTRRQQRGEYYPAEAIARGLQGEVLVFLMLDSAGSVVAARVEQSSGHRLLDDAALDAVRSLRSLPADAPREVLLPVRFRLD